MEGVEKITSWDFEERKPNKGSVSIILYYAEWCHFSREFMSTWKSIKQKIDEININTPFPILYEEYDDEHYHKQNGMAEIKGYPTIRIIKGDNMIDYEGDRTVDKILHVLLSSYEPPVYKSLRDYM